MTHVLSEGTGAASAAAPSPPMTYAGFLAWVGDEIHAEWVDGRAVMMAPVSNEHSDLGRFLLSLLCYYAEARQCGIVRYEPFQMKTGPDLPGRAPDILFLAAENLSRLREQYLDGPADLAIEIVSPESRVRDREEKFREYERGGVREYWLIDPAPKQAEFYARTEEGLYHLIPLGTDGVFRSLVLPGLWLQVDWLWQRPLPPLLDVLRQWKLI